jgi:hypothetical protein
LNVAESGMLLMFIFGPRGVDVAANADQASVSMT